MTTLINTFHNTEARTRLSDADLDALSYRIYNGTATDADKATHRRIWSKLCGINGCTCGDDFGRRS